jgi:hypothetical protein
MCHLWAVMAVLVRQPALVAPVALAKMAVPVAPVVAVASVVTALQVPLQSTLVVRR